MDFGRRAPKISFQAWQNFLPAQSAKKKSRMETEFNPSPNIKLEKRIMRGNKDGFSVNHPEALDKINIGNHVLVDNALLDLEVIDKHYD